MYVYMYTCIVRVKNGNGTEMKQKQLILLHATTRVTQLELFYGPYCIYEKTFFKKNSVK